MTTSDPSNTYSAIEELNPNAVHPELEDTGVDWEYDMSTQNHWDWDAGLSTFRAFAPSEF